MLPFARPAPETAMIRILALLFAALLTCTGAQATPPADAPADTPAAYDAELAQSLGADEYGMRAYVLVILRSGPTPLPVGLERDAMFHGHFANMKRLAGEGKLVLAGPLDGEQGRRGLFVLALDDLDEARRIVATDPVIARGEMVADYHRYYGSAALMLVNDWHEKLARKSP